MRPISVLARGVAAATVSVALLLGTGVSAEAATSVQASGTTAVAGGGSVQASAIQAAVKKKKKVKKKTKKKVKKKKVKKVKKVTKKGVTKAKKVTGSQAKAMFGATRSGLPWHSGSYTGRGMTASRMKAWEGFTGHPSDIATVYPGYGSWEEMAQSTWVPELMSGFKGRLAYGLPLLPSNRRGQWNDVLDGSHDHVFRGIARDLRRNGRGNTAIRVGLEANGDWFAWGATYDTAPQFRAAFQRVVRVMRAEAPGLTFWFDTSAGYSLPGQKSRLDGLTRLYPGDAYVDGISMDHYDHWSLQARTPAAFAQAMRPKYGPGLADAAEFARARKKGFAVPEWGLHGVLGAGDNPLFIQQMHAFFMANRDVLVFEAYFNEPDSYIANAIFSPGQMPKSAAMYRKVF